MTCMVMADIFMDRWKKGYMDLRPALAFTSPSDVAGARWPSSAPLARRGALATGKGLIVIHR